MKSKLKKAALLVLCMLSVYFILLVPIYLDKNTFSVSIYKSLLGATFITGAFLIFALVIFLACTAMGLFVSLVVPKEKQPPAPQKEPIVEGDITLESYYNFIMYAQKEGCYADRIPKCLQADFKAFMVGRTMQTEGHRSWVYPADMKLYADKLLYKGIDYPVQFKTD